MAVKSTIDIDLQGQEDFEAFAELYSKYSDQLSKTPAAWADASKEAKASYSTFSQIAAALLAQNALTKKKADAEKADAEKAETHELRAQSGYWSEMVRGSREVAANVAGITHKLLSIASIGTIFTGLVGAGSLFGLDRLADSVGAQRRRSLGLGVSYGESKAFDLNYGRVVDSGSFLSGVQESLQDVTKRSALYGAGLSEQDISGKNAAQVSVELIQHLKRLADDTDPALYGQLIQARNLSQFVTLQDLQRLRGTPQSEINSYALQYQKDRTSLGLDPQGQRIWQDFSIQMQRAGSKIENVFVRGLEPLISPLNHLSDSVVRAVDTFMSSGKLGPWIDELGHGIEWLAKKIVSPEFQKDVQDFAADVAALAGAAGKFLKFFGIIPSKPTDAPPVDFSHGPVGVLSSVKARAQANGLPTLWEILHGGVPQGWQSGEGGFEARYGLSRDLLDRVFHAEGRWTSRGWAEGPMTSSGTAKGPFQFTDATANTYGLKNPNDFWSAADAAGRLLRDLKKRYGGDEAKAVAAYNWNPKSVDTDIRTHGAEWRDFLPNETKKYLSKVLGPARTTVHLKVMNESGGNLVVQANQLSGGYSTSFNSGASGLKAK